MKKLHYNIDIQATPEQVYNTMLGLQDIKTYEQWTAAFNPTSTYRGTWAEGSKMLFVGTDEEGNLGGMVSRIVKNTPGEYVSIQHYGMMEKGVEITEGPKVEGWVNGFENYTLEKTATGTKLSVDLDSVDEYAEYFDETWPKALQTLKTACEGTK
jgi:hypothetical protein